MELEEEIRGKKIMVAIDESEESCSALLWAVDNLRDTFNSHRLLIFAAEPPPNYINIFAASLSSARLYSTVNNTADFVNSRQEIEKKVAIGILEKAKTICTSRGILAETILEEGDAKEAICEAVEKHHITILVLAEQRIGRVQA
ncbi:hypothetical protein V2J09_006096 [Rumex salicifolius]